MSTLRSDLTFRAASSAARSSPSSERVVVSPKAPVPYASEALPKISRSGRDALTLEAVNVELYPHSLVLRGHANASLFFQAPGRGSVPFQLELHELLGLRMEDVDFADHEPLSEGSFLVVVESRWLAEIQRRDFGGKVSKAHRHYLLQAYDDVVQVIASNHRFLLGAEVPDGDD